MRPSTSWSFPPADIGRKCETLPVASYSCLDVCRRAGWNILTCGDALALTTLHRPVEGAGLRAVLRADNVLPLSQRHFLWHDQGKELEHDNGRHGHRDANHLLNTRARMPTTMMMPMLMIMSLACADRTTMRARVGIPSGQAHCPMKGTPVSPTNGDLSNACSAIALAHVLPRR